MGEKRKRDPVEVVLMALFRLVTDQTWSPLGAAQHLRERVSDDRLLERTRIRVRWALAEKPSLFAERAAATLDLAVALGPSRPSGAGDANGVA